MPTTIIYAVSSREYSDYRVDALFTTREKAQAFIDAFKGDSYSNFNDIEEYELNPPVVTKLSHGWSVWRLIMLLDGTVEKCWRTNNDKGDVLDAGRVWLWERTKAPAYANKNIPDALQGSVRAKTEKQAIKVMNEKRIAFLIAKHQKAIEELKKGGRK